MVLYRPKSFLCNIGILHNLEVYQVHIFSTMQKVSEKNVFETYKVVDFLKFLCYYVDAINCLIAIMGMAKDNN